MPGLIKSRSSVDSVTECDAAVKERLPHRDASVVPQNNRLKERRRRRRSRKKEKSEIRLVDGRNEKEKKRRRECRVEDNKEDK